MFQFWLLVLQIVDFLKKKRDFVDLIIKHIGTSAIMDLLLRLLTCIEPPQPRQDVLNVSSHVGPGSGLGHPPLMPLVGEEVAVRSLKRDSSLWVQIRGARVYLGCFAPSLVFLGQPWKAGV